MPRKLTTEDFIKRASIANNNRFDYSLVYYEHSYTKVRIICPEHGVYEQRPDSHLRGVNGCEKCYSMNSSKSRTLTTDTFIQKAQEVWGNKYDYSLVAYKSTKTKVKIKCGEHGRTFEQRPHSHLRKLEGCSDCCSNISKGHLEIRQELQLRQVKSEEEKFFDECINPMTGHHLRFDFFLPEYNICIEFDGEQHFKPYAFGNDRSKETKLKNLLYLQYKDDLKNEFCKEQGIELLRIPYTQINNINKILIEKIDKAPFRMLANRL